MLRTTANGQGVVVVDHAKGSPRDWWVRPYQAHAPGQLTRDVLFDTFFGVAASELSVKTPTKGTWAPLMPLVLPGTNGAPWSPQDGANDAVFGYVGTSGVVREVRRSPDGVRLETYAWAPMGCPGRCLAMVAWLRNEAGPVLQVAVPLLINAHLGPGAPEAGSAGETLIIEPNGRTLLEHGPGGPANGWMWARGLDGAALSSNGNGLSAAAAVSNSYEWFQKGLPPPDDPGAIVSADDMVGTLHFQATLPSGMASARGALLVYGEGPVDIAAVEAWIGNRKAEKLLDDELAWWKAWHAKTKLPPLPPGETAELQRQLTLLKMAQCTLTGGGGPGSGDSPMGQIVASMSPGMWNITWPRDQSYAGVALAATGHHAEAKGALEFVLRGKVGQFQPEVGSPYRVSVTRYFGGGQEESDSNVDGPNIELDGFGLVLWQAARYIHASKDLDFVAKWGQDLLTLVADPLLKAVDATGLIKPDSSIWEVHWNGKQKHFAYTSMAAVRGLCGAAELATHLGKGTQAAQYRAAAKQLRGATVAQLAPDLGWLRGNLEEPASKALDLAAVEGLTDGQIAAWGPIAAASRQAWQALAASGGPGYIRNDDGGWYDSQEWLFVDLRVLAWLDRAVAMGAPWTGDRDLLRNHVLKTAAAGGGQVPELLAVTGDKAGNFEGATPMMGFGAGALVLALGGAAFGDDLSACLGAPLGGYATQIADPNPDAGVADAGVDGAAAAPVDNGVGNDDLDAGAASEAKALAEVAFAAPATDVGPPLPPAPTSNCRAGRSTGPSLGWLALVAFSWLLICQRAPRATRAVPGWHQAQHRTLQPPARRSAPADPR